MKLTVKSKCNLCNQSTPACYIADMDDKEQSIKCNAQLEIDESMQLKFYTIFTTGINMLSDFPVDANGEVPTFMVCNNAKK